MGLIILIIAFIAGIILKKSSLSNEWKIFGKILYISSIVIFIIYLLILILSFGLVACFATASF